MSISRNSHLHTYFKCISTFIRRFQTSATSLSLFQDMHQFNGNITNTRFKTDIDKKMVKYYGNGKSLGRRAAYVVLTLLMGL